MRLPLTAAILQHLMTVPEASAPEIVDALAASHGDERLRTVPFVEQALLTAMMNGLVDESRVETTDDGVRTWYAATPAGIDTIRKYIGEPVRG